MTMHRLDRWFVIGVGCLGLTQTAWGAIRIIQTDGTGGVSNQSIVNTPSGWEVSFSCFGTLAVGVTVDADAGEHIKFVEANVTSGQCQLFVDRRVGAATGISRLDAVRQSGGGGELIIQLVRVNGPQARIGGVGTAQRGLISSNVIGQVICDGDINADVVATTTALSSAANVILVRSVNGSITGNVQALAARVLTGRCKTRRFGDFQKTEGPDGAKMMA